MVSVKKIAWIVGLNTCAPEQVIITHEEGDASDFWRIEGAAWSWQSGIIGEDFHLTQSQAWSAAGRRKELDVAEIERQIERLQEALGNEKYKRDQRYVQARFYRKLEEQQNGKEQEHENKI